MNITHHKDSTVSLRLPRFSSGTNFERPGWDDVLYALRIAQSSAAAYGIKFNEKDWATGQVNRLDAIASALEGALNAR